MDHQSGRAPFFRGYAKVELEDLVFQQTVRTFDKKNVKRLVRIFRLEGCMREEVGNEIAAMINGTDLQTALSQSDVTQEQLFSLSETPRLLLPQNSHLVCLYGQHRIEAAKKTLKPEDQWWRIALYDDGLPKKIQYKLACEAPGAKEFAFGDIFRNLRLSRQALDDEAVCLWASRMSKRSKQDLDRLSRRHPSILKCFDKLLAYQGLWANICPALVRRLGELKCPSEIIHYIGLIHHIWSTIFPNDLALAVDPVSACYVQNLMPLRSTADAKAIERKLQSGVLFPSVVGSERDGLLSRLLTVSGRILTLYSLAQDTLFLEPCAKILHQLTPLPLHDLRESLLVGFNGSGNVWPVQMAENVIDDITVDDESLMPSHQAQQMATGYLQLWLFAMRYIKALSDARLAAPDFDRDTGGHIYHPAKKEAWRRLVILAQRLGFNSPQIQSINMENTLMSSTKNFLMATRPGELFEYPSHWERDATKRVMKILSMPRVRSGYDGSLPPLTVGNKEDSRAARKRCGLPVGQSYANDCHSLYISQIFCSDPPPGEFPTTFAIIRDIVFSFFGREILPNKCSSQGAPLHSHMSSRPVTPMSAAGSIPVSDSENTVNHPDGLRTNTQTERVTSLHASVVAALPDSSRTMDLETPMAVGFDLETSIAPLNKRTYLTHSKGAKEILQMWNDSRNAELSVFFFFKSREYCKFLVGDPASPSYIRSLVFEVANDHHFITVQNGEFVALSESDAIETAAQAGRLVLAPTLLESDEPPMIHYWDYICSFDPKTGKRARNTNYAMQRQPDRKKGKVSEDDSDSIT